MPMRNSTTNSGATSAPSASRGITTSLGHGTCNDPDSFANAASSPPLEMATRRAPAASAPRAISTVSSVSPEYERANASVRGPTNAGVR